MKKYFIAATGTDIGKTFITSALAYQMRAQGKNVMALKPVISGFEEGDNSDTAKLLDAQGLERSKENIDSISPWRFKAPLSPDMAAEDEDRHIDFAALNAFCKQKRNADYLLVEGVGGIMVPLDEKHTTLDWMVALGYPIILVTGSYLGSISHTLNALDTLLSRGLTLHTLIINESQNPPVSLERMCKTLARFMSHDIPVHTIKRLDSTDEIWEYVPDLTKLIL